jgi:hypothetical protein
VPFLQPPHHHHREQNYWFPLSWLEHVETWRCRNAMVDTSSAATHHDLLWSNAPLSFVEKPTIASTLYIMIWHMRCTHSKKSRAVPPELYASSYPAKSPQEKLIRDWLEMVLNNHEN